MAKFGEVIRAAARRDPTERALESDLLTRWPSGRRFMLTPYSVVGLLVLVGGIVAVPGICGLGPLLGGALAAGAMLLCFLVVGWFSPIARVVQQRFDCGDLERLGGRSSFARDRGSRGCCRVRF
ncbi:MAG: hypothetical protein KF680_11805 [Cryobacterium sp.]|nr:hypothetical protein [Cryobacterium sp.]